MQADSTAPFNPYTIHTVVNIVEPQGGPITQAELHELLAAALRYRQLIPAADVQTGSCPGHASAVARSTAGT